MIRFELLLIPFALQMVCMVFDEFCFHRSRTVPRWERLGHPLDTLSVLICWTFVLLTRPTSTSIAVYAAMCGFSCLFVTKDEWVHAKWCRPGEHWLHAVLFILHPLTFLSAGLMWKTISVSPTDMPALVLFGRQGFERTVLTANVVMTLFFGLYQFIYWNLLWKDTSKVKSTDVSMTS